MFLRLCTTVHRFVGEGVGVGIFFAEDVHEGHRAEGAGDLREARLLFFEDRMPHFVFFFHLLHYQLAVHFYRHIGELALGARHELQEFLKGEDARLLVG